MRKIKEFFFLGIFLDVGKGRCTRFWIDRWCSFSPLCCRFSELFSLAYDSYGLVVSHWNDGCWNIKVLELESDVLSAKREELLQFLPKNL